MRGGDTINTRKRKKKKSAMSAEDVLELLNVIAQTSPADLCEIEDDGEGRQKAVWKQFDSLPEETKLAIANIKNTKDGVEIGLMDRMKILEMLSKHFGEDKIVDDRVIIVGENEIED
jgi:hypothetical protein